jgi:hypothetical protein
MIEIIEAEYLTDYKLKLVFSNSEVGIIDFKEYCHRVGLFSKLKDLNYFKMFKIDNELGTICWDNGLDIAPDTLYNKTNQFF